MEKNIEIGILYQYYKDLLSEKQSEAIEQYYIEDLSLTEIAEISGVSKQAISNNIKRSEKLLLEYEKSLKLYTKLNEISNFLEKLDLLIKDKIDEKTYSSIKYEISLLNNKIN